MLASFPDRHIGYRVHYPIEICLSDRRDFCVGRRIAKIDRERLTVADSELDRIQTALNRVAATLEGAREGVR